MPSHPVMYLVPMLPSEVVVTTLNFVPPTVNKDELATAKLHNTVRGNVSTPATLSSVQTDGPQSAAVDGPLMILGKGHLIHSLRRNA
jgi:hypothetical protein